MSEQAASTEHAEGHGDGHDHHDVSFYIKTYVALLVLLVVSVLGPEVGEVTGIQAITLFTAFGIAVIKAGLVIRNFMHLNVEKSFVHYFLITSLAFMFLFFFAVSPDVLNHEGSRWVNEAAKAEIERAQAAHEAGGGHGHGDAHGDEGHGDAHGDEHGDAHGDEGHGDGGHH